MEERVVTLGDVLRGEHARDCGIAQAVSHADAVTPAWSDMAYKVLLEYGPKLGRFTPFDIRACAIAAKVPDAPDSRAWGHVLKRALKAKKIHLVTYVPHPDPRCHRCPTKLWAWAGAE